MTISKAVEILNRGGIGVLPTDTLYGLVGRALDEQVVERIYKLRKRNRKKPVIILTGSFSDLRGFGVRINRATRKILNRVWPGPVTVVLPLGTKATRKFKYLHRGVKSLAFRLPKPIALRKLLAKTGPLVAPSANIEGAPPARNLRKAREYFGDKVDFYISGGLRKEKPSTLIKITDGEVIVLRRGAGKV